MERNPDSLTIFTTELLQTLLGQFAYQIQRIVRPFAQLKRNRAGQPLLLFSKLKRLQIVLIQYIVLHTVEVITTLLSRTYIDVGDIAIRMLDHSPPAGGKIKGIFSVELGNRNLGLDALPLLFVEIEFGVVLLLAVVESITFLPFAVFTA